MTHSIVYCFSFLCQKYYYYYFVIVTNTMTHTMEHLKMTPSVEITRRHSMVFLFYVKNMVSFFVIQMLGLEAEEIL
jgi:hypothetical protein